MEDNVYKSVNMELLYGGEDFCYFRSNDRKVRINYDNKSGKARLTIYLAMGMLFANEFELENLIEETKDSFHYNLNVNELDWKKFWDYWKDPKHEQYKSRKYKCYIACEPD